MTHGHDTRKRPESDEGDNQQRHGHLIFFPIINESVFTFILVFCRKRAPHHGVSICPISRLCVRLDGQRSQTQCYKSIDGACKFFSDSKWDEIAIRDSLAPSWLVVVAFCNQNNNHVDQEERLTTPNSSELVRMDHDK